MSSSITVLYGYLIIDLFVVTLFTHKIITFGLLQTNMFLFWLSMEIKKEEFWASHLVLFSFFWPYCPTVICIIRNTMRSFHNEDTDAPCSAVFAAVTNTLSDS